MFDHDPSLYFVDALGRECPLVVEHATGEPKFAVVDGSLVPFAAWQETQHRPAAGSPRGMTIASPDGSFTANIEVS